MLPWGINPERNSLKVFFAEKKHPEAWNPTTAPKRNDRVLVRNRCVAPSPAAGNLDQPGGGGGKSRLGRPKSQPGFNPGQNGGWWKVPSWPARELAWISPGYEGMFHSFVPLVPNPDKVSKDIQGVENPPAEEPRYRLALFGPYSHMLKEFVIPWVPLPPST
ncbi:hypothetical protein DPEC_G00331560 [Dallia pectoralis]|uniref:Uncharacterized protein n=1 Tax=Dallia pectoralis TaxID=75939 RepID=A0ACC2F5V8_DALPE|nr:hypothetical protein DPEC_G00331560 [Dallia pectoralis]